VSRLVRSELVKLRTTRTFLGITLAALGLIALIAGAGAAAGTYGASDPSPGRDLLEVGGLAQPFALVLGVLAVSTEFRHGTITPSLLTVPRRAQLVLAKLIAHGVAGLVLGLVAYGLAAALALPILSVRGISSDLGFGTTIEVLAGGLACLTLLAAIGVGAGAIVRNQVGAVMAALGWWIVVEPLLAAIPKVGDSIAKYGIDGAVNAASATSLGADPELGQVAGGLLLLAYAAIFAAAGIAVLRQRDVTA
jgi:ABC-2 type transport system permease protein